MNSLNKFNFASSGFKSSVGFGLMSIIALMMVPTTISDVFAENEMTLTWQLVFIKSEECGPNDNLDQIYAELTSKYLEVYEIENTVYDFNCMSEQEYQEFEMNEESNLLVIVYDKSVGSQILEPNKIDGIYVHTGNDRNKNHLVLMCHCSDYDTGYERTLPSWILSHELSHFVLSYKGFPQTEIQESIHEIEEGYDTCVGANFQTASCDQYTMTIQPDSLSKDFVVMAPYEPAVGNKMVQYIPDDYDDSEVIELQRNLAKMWVTNAIDTPAYAETLSHFVGAPMVSEFGEADPFMTIPNGFVIAETSKPRDVTWDEYLGQGVSSQEGFNNLLEHIPFDLEEQGEEFSVENMPNWFKTRALLWSEQRISDKVFFDGVEHLVRLNVININ